MLINKKQKRFSVLKKKNHFKNLKKIFYKISFFLILSLNSFDYKKNIKICLCTVGKEENKYIIEFVEHYQRYGIDKIFLYDNNYINGEIFDLILTKYITIGFLEIINKRGYIGKQLSMLQECYEKNYKIYDWLLFFDIDEYIHLQKYQNIKYFLINKKFDKCQSIYLNWKIHTDNNLIYYVIFYNKRINYIYIF